MFLIGMPEIGEWIVIFLLPISLCLYFLPSILGRKKSNFTTILLLNIFVGWTFIGWVVCLIWALSNDQNPIETSNAKPEDNLDKLSQLKDLLDKRAITEDEYNQMKRRIIN